MISVGIYPAAAAYNGFHCLDGYSNNYPLEYKHAFRQIMEGELDKMITSGISLITGGIVVISPRLNRQIIIPLRKNGTV